MGLQTLDSVLSLLREHGVVRVLAKRLAENDNSKQQIYLGDSFDALNLLPFGDVYAESGRKHPVLKAPLSLSWMDHQGSVSPAPGSKLILYTGYPEVRLSGFLRNCGTAPSDRMQPVPAAYRRHNNSPDGRILILGITRSSSIIAFLIDAGSAMATEFETTLASRTPVERGVFLEFLPDRPDSRSQLLSQLRGIYAAGWHDSCRLKGDGTRIRYTARNGAGYTLEALLGITPNGRAEPDFLGWEVKACGSGRITLMTPEPDAGYYGTHGVEAFLRIYGRPTTNDTLYFTGTHRAGVRNRSTGQKLVIHGFDPSSGRITDPGGGLQLVAGDQSISASWSFSRLLLHWGRKHSAAVYVPYESQYQRAQYRYQSPVLLGEGTDFIRFLSAMAAGSVVYDPGPKLVGASGPKPSPKARSQFRISKGSLNCLYKRFSAEALD